MKEIDKAMYFNAKPLIFSWAKLLRDNMTKAEALLWERLKKKQIAGIRFRRQHPIDIFIVDFYCHDARLVIELDGEIHNFQSDYDNGRTSDLSQYGIKVIRFDNSEVENNIDKVLITIKNEIEKRISSPPWGI